LDHVLSEVEIDGEIRVLILTGGLELFGVGADIEVLSELESSRYCYGWAHFLLVLGGIHIELIT
jgi:enoyl-CoA hydratase/carnithine racemase